MSSPNKIKYSEQELLNLSFDDTYKMLAMMNMQWDGGTKAYRPMSDNTATILDDSADPILYVGKAPIGTATSAASWQIVKLDTSSGMIKTWADGDGDFDNIWDDRVSLSYS